MSVSSSGNVQKTVCTLRARCGEIRWRAGDRDEVMIGAILTRQTRWVQLTRALAELRLRGLCSIPAVRSAGLRDIGRPYGAQVISKKPMHISENMQKSSV